MYRMSKFEKKFGKYAIPNLPLVLILCYAVGYVIQLINPSFLYYLTLNPYEILHGQVWRLLTWIVVPPSSFDFLFTLLMLYFYWSLGTTLEHIWGTYRFNVYMFSGFLFTIIGSFVAMGLVYLLNGEAWNLADPAFASAIFDTGSLFFSTEHINMSIFLAMAATIPNMEIRLWFIIPIKMKWMGIVYAVLLAWQFFTPVSILFLDFSIFNRIALLSSLLNFIIFFLLNVTKLRSPKQVKRQIVYKREVHRTTKTSSHHKCAICGRTDETHPDLEFRYCSKCNGNYEYCQDHLFTHTHVQ